MTTCKSILQLGNFLRNLHCPSALPPTCLVHVVQSHVIKPQTIALQTAATAKGLTMTPALAAVLTPYFQFMRRHQVYPQITHIPGRLNVLADELSRFKEPLSVAVGPMSQQSIPWIQLLQSSGIEITQTGRKWPSYFDIHLREKGLLQSADWVLPSIGFWGVLTPAGRWSSYLVLFGTPHLYWLTPTYPGLWVVDWCQFEWGSVSRSCCTNIGPAGSNTLLYRLDLFAPRLKQKAPAQLP